MCGGKTAQLREREDISLRHCPACGFVSGFPKTQVTTEERYRAYYLRPPAPPPENRYGQWLDRAERLVGRGRLLEVGAGSGGFSRVALARGWEVHATEVSESAIAVLKETAAAVFAGEVEQAAYPTGHFDFVVSLEVIEHVPLPAAHLAELCRICRSGGLLLLTTPNIRGLSARALGSRWRVVDAEHLGYFAPGTLRRALRDAGFLDAVVRSRSIDVTAWRRAPAAGQPLCFDPTLAAELRQRVEGSRWMRLARDIFNATLGRVGLGDSLLAWARR
jgi:SAM-dependent methyltransferase